MGMGSLGTTASQDELFRHGVETAFAEGLAAQDAPAGQDGASRRPEAGYGNPCIIGTGWMEPAAGSQEGAEPPLVEGQQ